MAKILIIDDDQLILETLKLVLGREGHEITEASDGAEGLDAYWKDPADLVITDVVMPGQEGIETLMMLKNEKSPPKIIMISGGGNHSASRYLHLAKQLGADVVLEKPLKRDVLLKEVNRLLEPAK